MDSHIQDKIERHLLGRMTEEEKKAFEAEMDANEELKKQYLATKALEQEKSEQVLMKENTGQRDKEREKEKGRPVSSSSKRKWMYAAIGMAATVLVAFFFLHIETTEKGDDPVSEERTALSKEVDSLVEIKEYAKALEIIEGQLTESDNFIDFCKKCIDQNVPEEYADEALPPKEAQEELTKAYAEMMDTKLMKAQVLLKMEEKEKATSILKELTHETSAVQEKAKELLEEFN